MAGDGSRRLVQAGFDSLELSEESGAGVDEFAALGGEHDPSADSFEQRDSRLAFEPFDLLGDGTRGESERVCCGDDRALDVDGPKGTQCGKVDHEAVSIMKQRYMNSGRSIRWCFIAVSLTL